MNIEFNHLRHAVVLSECMHFGNAAKSLQLSQPALSRSISNLESKLGRSLFIRGTKSITTTDFGRLFIEKAKVLLQSVNAFTVEMIEDEQESFSKIEIGVGPYPAETIVASASIRFAKAFPKIELIIRVDSIENMLSALIAGNSLECIIAETSVVNTMLELEVMPMGRYPVVITARAGHPLAGKNPSLLQLLQYPVITTSRLPPRSLGPLHATWKKIPAIQRPALPAFECASLSVTKRIILESDAIAGMQLSAIASELESGELIILRSEPWLHLNYGFVQKKGVALSHHASEFKRMLFKEELALAKQEKRLSKQYLGK